ncbi:MAG: MBL fold metallo-hydrolase [Salinirussus sp.]
MVERVRIPTATRAPGGATHAHVIGETLLVDPAGTADALDTAITEAGVSHVAVTHTHPDHVGGVAHYAQRYDLTVWARAGRENEFHAATGIRPDRTFLPGTTLPGGVPVLDTPGHAPEHVAFGAQHSWITGDLAVAEGSVVVGAPEGDMRAYLTSLRRVYAMAPERLYPGHGAIIDNPRATCARLIGHRLAREERVLKAVETGAEAIDDIVAAAYDKDVAGVKDLARATVRSHLEKLAVEGRLEWNGQRAIPANFSG